MRAARTRATRDSGLCLLSAGLEAVSARLCGGAIFTVVRGGADCDAGAAVTSCFGAVSCGAGATVTSCFGAVSCEAGAAVTSCFGAVSETLRSAATGEAGRAATGVLAGSSTTIRAGTGVGEDKAPVRCASKYPLTAVARPAATISTNLTTKREKTEASRTCRLPLQAEGESNEGYLPN